MKYLITYILVFTTTFTFSQDVNLKEIELLATNTLMSTLKDSTLISFCYPNNSFGVSYTYKKSTPLFNWVIDLDDIEYPLKKLKILTIKTCGYFAIPYPECPALDTIGGRYCIVFDEESKIIEKPNLSFIPDSYYSKDSCNLLSKSQLLQIIDSQNPKFGSDSLSTKLEFDKTSELYIWYTSKSKCKLIDEKGRCWGEIEIYKVNAITGDVISHYITSLGHP